jgi:hypothetical protein
MRKAKRTQEENGLFSCRSPHGSAPNRLDFSVVLARARFERIPAPRPESP